MNEFLNLNDDDEAEDEEGAAKVTVEATVREGNVARQGMKARVANQVAEIHGAKASVGVTLEVLLIKDSKLVKLALRKGLRQRRSLDLIHCKCSCRVCTCITSS